MFVLDLVGCHMVDGVEKMNSLEFMGERVAARLLAL
jgi:hypothetical protein